ncbi:MAG: DNA primase [Anaerolineae bacterium]
MSVIEDIKSRLDIVEYIGRFVPLKRAGRYYKAPCPWHSERTASFIVDQDKQYCRCYGACGEGGDIFFFAQKQNGWSFQEALEELAKLAGVELKPQSPEQKEKDAARDRLRAMLGVAADYFHERLFDSRDPNAQMALQYAREKRKLTDETIERFKIGYAPAGWRAALDALGGLGYSEEDLLNAGLISRNDKGKVYDKFRHRLMIPIHDERGRTVGFGARALNPDDNPKYLNSPQTLVFDKSHLLFGLDFAQKTIRDTETAVIVEGYMDAISLHQAGYPNVVAQMGTALTDAQLNLIAPKWAKRIVMALDSDAAGQNAMRRSLDVAVNAIEMTKKQKLAVEFRIFLNVPGAKDPDELVQEDPASWGQLVDNAIPVADFVIDMEAKTLPSNASVIERENAARRLLPILLMSENDLYKRDSLQKLALKLHIPERDLLAWAGEQQRIQQAAPPRPRRTDAPPRGDSAPPEPPPLPDWEPENPYADVPNFDAPIPPAPPQAAAKNPRELAVLERYCLRILYQQPNLIYHVNRKFREIAGENSALVQGPLGEIGADDFSRSDMRALMVILMNALAQDELEVYDYVQRNVEAELLEELYALMDDPWEDLRPRLSFGLSADLPIIIHQNERSNGAVNAQAEILEHALRLRLQRLERTVQEIAFIQMEQPQGEPPESLDAVIAITTHARRRIQEALSRGQHNGRNKYGKKA